MKIENVKKAIQSVKRGKEEDLELLEKYDGCIAEERIRELVEIDDVILECLQTELDRQENKALTLSELKEMVGEPVWASHVNEWTIIKNVDSAFDTVTMMDSCGNVIMCTFNEGCEEWFSIHKHKPTEGVGR